MPDDRYTSELPDAERQARELAALIDAAGDDLDRNGPLPSAALRRRLQMLEAEWVAAEAEDESSSDEPRLQMP
jgi:spore germination cell wall hydrolase CwlJ-like protein